MNRRKNIPRYETFLCRLLAVIVLHGWMGAAGASTPRGQEKAGADWWSLQPIVRPAPPPVRDTAWMRNPIDVFVLARLEAEGLSPAPPAEPRALIRRLYFDLIGLPPEPAEVERFVSDHAAGADAATSALASRLLASPHYGERWGRHWLDVARYGESDGFEYDKLRPHAWAYRDWVIRALNDDMPYDRFMRLQIAGDVLEPGDADAITATSFLVCGAFDGLKPAGEKMREAMRQDEMEDLVGIVGQTFLGLTVHCARCHDHKFDPISQKEYYRMASALAGVGRGDRDVPPDERTVEGKERRQVFAVTPQDAPVTHLLIRGSPFQPAEAVSPGGVESIQGMGASFGLPPDAPEAARRRALAEWIADSDNPLPARVLVNRVWHYHFGQGLVKTPNDFGYSGGEPSHPELLDWLAGEFRDHGWSLKALHGWIVTSAAYRQSARHDPVAHARDAGNTLLWRHAPARMEAEVLRDSILQVAGQLNRTMGGPGFHDFDMRLHKGSWVYDPIDPAGAAFNRRSIYRTWARGGDHPLLSAFDCPDPSATAPVRGVTTTPLGALSLMNNSFVLRMADHFAARLEREAGAEIVPRIERAYALAFGRPPSAEEVEMNRAFIEANGLPAFCRVLFNANEFLYVN